MGRKSDYSCGPSVKSVQSVAMIPSVFQREVFVITASIPRQAEENHMRVQGTGVAGITILIAAFAAVAQEPNNGADIRINVDVVQVPVSVTRLGVAVKDMMKEDFQLRENAAPQAVKYFWQETDLPLSVGLIVDVSGSQNGLIGKHRETVTRFLRQVLGPRDRAMLITVGTQARLVTDFTGSIE